MSYPNKKTRRLGENESARHRLHLFSLACGGLIYTHKVANGFIDSSMRHGICCTHPLWASRSLFWDPPTSGVANTPSAFVQSRSRINIQGWTTQNDSFPFLRCPNNPYLPILPKRCFTLSSYYNRHQRINVV